MASHIKVTKLKDGKVRLTPHKGYRMYHAHTQVQHSEAVVKEKGAKFFVAEKEK